MRKGFTLIELVLVIAILTILAGAMVPIISSNREEARRARAMTEVDAIKSAALMYHTDTDQWPAAVGDLITRPAAVPAAVWRGPYLDQAGNDPWAQAYVLRTVGTALWAQSLGADTDNDSCADLACAGADSNCDHCVLIHP